MNAYLLSGAEISPCGNYRYRLWRGWDRSRVAICVFVMLNPSTADADQDDPTIRRCVAFAKRLGCTGIEVINLFAWRATSPKELLAIGPERDPCGSGNQRAFLDALAHPKMIVCAWGAHGTHLGQDQTALGWIDQYNDRGAPVVALGLTKKGQPRHPLYLPSDAQPIPYGGGA